MGRSRRRTWGTSSSVIICLADSLLGTWVIEGHGDVTRGVIVVSYLFVCSFAITMGPGTCPSTLIMVLG